MNLDAVDSSLIETLLRQYARIQLDVDLEHLAGADRQALRKLMESAPWIDRIYWKQRSEEGWRLRQGLAGSADERARKLQRLLDINFGPWDTFADDRPFWGDRMRPAGGDLYPADLTREELDRYVTRHPDQRKSLLSHTTLVRRDHARLVAVPYHEAYAEELAHVAKCLTEASALATHPEFRAFLRARAEGLVAGTLRESDTLWIRAADSPIDIAIGPYEVYDDALMGLKTSYESTVMVRHPEMTDRIRHFGMLAKELQHTLPGAVAPDSHERRFGVGVYDVVVAAGMSNMGGKAIAAALPNDEWVRTNVGARLFLFRNVITAKFKAILQPLAAKVLEPEANQLVTEEAFLHHTMLHELAHAVAEGFVRRGDAATDTTINQALRERYSTIEECRADVLGLVFLDLLAGRGAFGPRMRSAAAVTFIASGVRALRFGAGDDYTRTAAIILSHLLKSGAVATGRNGGLAIDVEAVHAGVANLAKTVQHIATTGDYEGAGALIAELSTIPREVQALLPRVADIPVDLEFAFQNSSRLL